MQAFMVTQVGLAEIGLDSETGQVAATVLDSKIGLLLETGRVAEMELVAEHGQDDAMRTQANLEMIGLM
jgi:hypothetical protein